MISVGPVVASRVQKCGRFARAPTLECTGARASLGNMGATK